MMRFVKLYGKEVEVTPVWVYSLKKNNWTGKVTGVKKIEGWTVGEVKDDEDNVIINYISNNGNEKYVWIRRAKEGVVDEKGRVWLLEDNELRARGAFINYMNQQIAKYEKSIQNCLDTIVFMEEP